MLEMIWYAVLTLAGILIGLSAARDNDEDGQINAFILSVVARVMAIAAAMKLVVLPLFRRLDQAVPDHRSWLHQPTSMGLTMICCVGYLVKKILLAPCIADLCKPSGRREKVEAGADKTATVVAIMRHTNGK